MSVVGPLTSGQRAVLKPSNKALDLLYRSVPPNACFKAIRESGFSYLNRSGHDDLRSRAARPEWIKQTKRGARASEHRFRNGPGSEKLLALIEILGAGGPLPLNHCRRRLSSTGCGSCVVDGDWERARAPKNTTTLAISLDIRLCSFSVICESPDLEVKKKTSFSMSRSRLSTTFFPNAFPGAPGFRYFKEVYLAELPMLYVSPPIERDHR